MRRDALLACTAAMTPALAGCALASATAGAAISVTGAVVSTGVQLTGRAIGAGVDAMTPAPDADDRSGIVIREHIRTESPTTGANGTGDRYTSFSIATCAILESV